MPTAEELMREINAALKSDVLRLASSVRKQEVVPTGVLPIDYLLNGGFPRGRMTEIYGAPSALKSYLGLCSIREAQKRGGLGALLDTERTFDPEWAEDLGVDLDRLILWPPAPADGEEQTPVTGEMALDAAEALLRSRGVDVLVFDSVAAALPQDLQNKRMSGESIQPGRLAAMMSIGLRKLTAANENTAIVWINQLRTNIGVTFGNPESAPGGKSLPYYASIRLNIKGVGKIKKEIKIHDGEGLVKANLAIGQKFKAITEKNKLDSPNQEVHFTWLNGEGAVDETGFLMAKGLEDGILTQAGAMWRHEGQSFRGKEEMKKALNTDPVLREAVRAAVFASRGSHGRRKNVEDRRSAVSSGIEELENIQAQAAARSASTGRRKKS